MMMGTATIWLHIEIAIQWCEDLSQVKYRGLISWYFPQNIQLFPKQVTDWSDRQGANSIGLQNENENH